MLHDLVVRKIKKLEFRHILQKTLIRKIKKPDFGTLVGTGPPVPARKGL
jgi:hypothetical protein